MKIEEKFFETKWGRIAYLASGNFDWSIVFLHGIAGWPVLVKEMATGFNQAGFNYLAPYLPGHGDSFSLPPRFNFLKMVEAVEEFIEEVAGEKTIIVGHSLGGAVALGMLEKGAKIKGAVLADSYAGGTYRHFEDLVRFAGIWARNKLEDYRSYRVYHAVEDNKLVRSKIRWDQLLGYWWLAKSIHIDPAKLEGNIPVITLWGEDDNMTPIVGEQKILQKLDVVEQRVFPGMHYWFARNPAGLISEVVNFAESVKLGKV